MYKKKNNNFQFFLLKMELYPSNALFPNDSIDGGIDICWGKWSYEVIFRIVSFLWNEKGIISFVFDINKWKITLLLLSNDKQNADKLFFLLTYSNFA